MNSTLLLFISAGKNLKRITFENNEQTRKELE